MLDPEAPIEPEESTRSTKNTFKATFGEISKFNLMVVVVLPFRVPDNMCHFAAQEATMVLDQFLTPDYEQGGKLYGTRKFDNDSELYNKIDAYMSSIIY